MDDPLETAELLAFTKTVDAHSLSRAAAELGVPRATVGRRLQRLEERLGVRLLRRTTRSLVLTDAGEALYRQARIALEAVQQAEASVRRTDESVRGELRVAVPPFSSPGFYALINDFALRHPGVRLQLHFSTQVVDLRRAGFDLAVRGSSTFEPGLVARVLLRTPLVAVASPAYLAQYGTPQKLRDLKQHRCLSSFARGELPQTHWTDKKGRKVQVESSLSSNDIAFLRQMALGGLGIAFLPLSMVHSSLERGRLVQVLKGILEAESRLAIVYPEREFLPPQVRAFVDAFTAWASQEGETGLWPPPPADEASFPAQAAVPRKSTRVRKGTKLGASKSVS